ncbi:DivIVA domain-containing protein [Streptomyces sp. DSM 44915]|uniref:DivIVA domain-containing protein n=1 Tax=Streptomyces chisholmiae TaxID=3075540 RepID=A0ABU2JKD6_9ACTN|nr:DivIVA domain-containing protein [Streptomyces sp. DSM 44915]MDT0265456.1 DivIVA domain-containing protein [Streptomyces sp. DSM 44915]
MFWFLMVAMVVVIAAVTLAVLGSGDGSGAPATGGLRDAQPDRPADPLPLERPLVPADLIRVRLPVAPRGYRMAEVDDVLDRVAAELAERDARIADLQAALERAAGPADHSGAPDPAAAEPTVPDDQPPPAGPTAPRTRPDTGTA